MTTTKFTQYIDKLINKVKVEKSNKNIGHYFIARAELKIRSNKKI